MSDEHTLTPPQRPPRLPIYLDGDLVEALAQTLDPSGVPGTRRVRSNQAGRTLEGSGYAVRASGRIGARLLGAQAGAEAERDKKIEDESKDDRTEEQEFVVQPATLLWQAYNILREEGHLRVVGRDSIEDLKPGDWVEMSVRSTGRSVLSLSRLLERVVALQAQQRGQRLDHLREGETLLRGGKPTSGVKVGSMSISEARQLFLSDLVVLLAQASDEDGLQATAAVQGFADELLHAAVSDIRAEFVDRDLAAWTALLTVRTENHVGLAQGALYDAEFGVFGKVSLVRDTGEGVSLVRRTMLDWMDTTSLQSMSEGLQSTMSGATLTVEPPLVQVLPLALWV